MGRVARSQILYDGCYAHVFSRALEREDVFRAGGDFAFFKDLLSRTKAKHGFRIYHYCLMNTHFHLAVSISQLKTFSEALKEIKQGYAAYMTMTYDREGPVWWGRFKSQLIEDENYLYACGLYIERNPLKAGMVAKPEEWPHSSARHYFLGEKDPLVDPYETPPLEKVEALVPNLDFTRGNIIGSPLLQLQIEERSLSD